MARKKTEIDNACYNVPAPTYLTHTVPHSVMASTVPECTVLEYVSPERQGVEEAGIMALNAARPRDVAVCVLRADIRHCIRPTTRLVLCLSTAAAASAALAALSRAQARTESMSQAIPPIRNHAFVPPPTPSPTATQTLRVLDKVSVRGWGYVLLQRMGPCVILMPRVMVADVMGRQYAGRQTQMPCAHRITTAGAGASV